MEHSLDRTVSKHSSIVLKGNGNRFGGSKLYKRKSDVGDGGGVTMVSRGGRVHCPVRYNVEYYDCSI